MIKRNICSVEGCNSYVWKQGKCNRHSEKTTMEKKPMKMSSETRTRINNKLKEKGALFGQQVKLFLEIWDERADKNGNNYCFETGKLLRKEYYRESTTCYHHCLFKEKYPEYRFLKENIVILHPDVHAQVHVNVDKTPKVKQYTLELRNKLLSSDSNSEEQ